jgi:hypothetical protein
MLMGIGTPAAAPGSPNTAPRAADAGSFAVQFTALQRVGRRQNPV